MPPITEPFQGKIDVDLTNLAVEHRNKTFVADLIAPLVQVTDKSNKFPIFGKESLMDPGNIVRAPTAAAIELVQTMSRDTYTCEDHAASRLVALEERGAMNMVRDPYAWATRMLLDRVILLKRELEIISLATAAATYNTSNKTTLAGATKWSDKTGSDPVGNVLAMAKAVALGSGAALGEMTMVIGWDTFEVLKVHPVVKERFVNARGGAITLREISEVFEMPVQLSSTRKSTAAGVLSFAWDDTVWIGFVNPSPNLEDVSFAKTFLLTSVDGAPGGIAVERNPVYPASRKSESVDVHYWHSDAKVITKDAGAIIIDTV